MKDRGIKAIGWARLNGEPYATAVSKDNIPLGYVHIRCSESEDEKSDGPDIVVYDFINGSWKNRRFSAILPEETEKREAEKELRSFLAA